MKFRLEKLKIKTEKNLFLKYLHNFKINIECVCTYNSKNITNKK